MKLVIQARHDYLLHFTSTVHDDGTTTIKIESQWTGAKDPNGLQTRWQATLDNDEWFEIANFIFDGSNHGQRQNR